METRRMMSVTTPDSILLGGPDTQPAGDVATETIVIVHEGLKRASTPSVGEIVVTKSIDCASTPLF
jgi:hypothetical protein